MGIPFPKEYGGAGLDALSYAIAVEELARVDGGAGVILSAHVSLGSWPIFAYGTEEQKKKYLVPLAKGEKIGAFGLTEPNAGSDAGGTETTALDKGDYYLLNGGKIFITNAPKADTYVVFAVTTPDIGTRGISAFIVEKGWKGFEFGDHYDKMGIRSSSTAELIFNDVKVPKENLLGKEGEGFKIAMSISCSCSRKCSSRWGIRHFTRCLARKATSGRVTGRCGRRMFRRTSRRGISRCSRCIIRRRLSIIRS